MNDDMGSSQGPSQGPAKSTSEARYRANRANAQKSTGPRTDAGKAASSRNAERHGMYASGGVPISCGPFLEDADEVQRFTETIVSALAPKDGIEEAWAARIAGLMLRAGRIDKFEVRMLEGTDRMSPAELQAMGDEDLLWLDYELADQLDGWLAGCHGRDAAAWSKPDAAEESPPALYYEACARFLRRCNRPVKVRGLWDNDHTPGTSAEWKRVFEVVVRHLFERPIALDAWLTEVRRDRIRRHLQVQGTRAEAVARRSITQLERTTTMQGSVGRQLGKAIEGYRQLQERWQDEDDD